MSMYLESPFGTITCLCSHENEILKVNRHVLLKQNFVLLLLGKMHAHTCSHDALVPILTSLYSHCQSVLPGNQSCLGKDGNLDLLLIY